MTYRCFHTYDEVENPWWLVDLGDEKQVDSVKITNRLDCCGEA